MQIYYYINDVLHKIKSITLNNGYSLDVIQKMVEKHSKRIRKSLTTFFEVRPKEVKKVFNRNRTEL